MWLTTSDDGKNSVECQMASGGKNNQSSMNSNNTLSRNSFKSEQKRRKSYV